VIKIDEEKCNGCGECVPACAEGAIAIVDGVAKLVSEVYCDGLGACLGECPEDAITIEEREAAEFDEEATKRHLEKLNRPTPKDLGSPVPAGGAEHHKAAHEHHKAAHEHAKAHAMGGCPGSRMVHHQGPQPTDDEGTGRIATRLRQWPVQLMLVPPNAPYFQGAELLLTADCVPFAYAEYHRDFLQDKALVVGCPKLDDLNFYQEKLTQILTHSDIKSLTVLIMEVPCCFGLVQAARQSLQASGKKIPLTLVNFGLDGTIRQTHTVEPALENTA
jgi:Fe-S-cluster-containing hydrogenase component 2